MPKKSRRDSFDFGLGGFGRIDMGFDQPKTKKPQDFSLLGGLPEITSDFRKMVSDTKRDASYMKNDIISMRNDMAPIGRVARRGLQKGRTMIQKRMNPYKYYVYVNKGGINQRFEFSTFDTAKSFALRAANNSDVLSVKGPFERLQ